MDGVILPVAAHTAVPEGLFKHYGKHIARFRQVHLAFAAYVVVPGVLYYTTDSTPVTFANEIEILVVFEHALVNNKNMENWMMCKAHSMPCMQGGRLTMSCR